MVLLLKCYKARSSSEGGNRIVAVETAGLAVRLPDQIQYAAYKVPDTDSDRWYETVPESDWKTAVTLHCEKAGLSGWQVDEERFQPGDNIRFALRDPAQPDGELPGIGRGLDLDKSWRPQSLLDPWPCAEEASGGGMRWRSLLAVFASLAVMAIVLWLLFNDTVDLAAISLEVHPGQAILLDFDTDGRVTGTRGRPFKVSPVREPSLGRVVVLSDRVLQYTAPEDKDGLDSFEYRVTLSGNGTPPESATAQLHVSIVNRPPIVKEPYRHKPIATNEQPVFDLSEVVRDEDIKPGQGLQLELVGCKQNDVGEIKRLAGLRAQFFPSGRTGKSFQMDCQVKDPVGAMVDITLILDVVSPTPFEAASIILSEVHPGQTLLLDFDADYEGKVTGTRGRPFKVSPVHKPVLGEVVAVSDRVLQYTAPEDKEGSDRFEYKVALNGSGAPPEIPTSQINIQIVNRRPTVTGPYRHKPIATNERPEFDLSEVVRDEDIKPGQGLQLELVDCKPNKVGEIKRLGGLRAQFYPSGQTGKSFQIDCQVKDPVGARVDVSMLFDVVPNDLPIITVRVRAGAEQRIDPGQLLRDAGYPDLIGLAVVAVDQPDQGSTRLEGGQILFTPPFDFSGVAQFAYQAKDQGGQLRSGIVKLPIDPQPFPDAREPKPIPVGTTRILDLATLVEGWSPTWRLSSVGAINIGDLRKRDDEHSVEFRAPVDRDGQVTFSFTATGGQGQSGAGRISLTVANNRPTARDIQVTGRPDATIPIDLSDDVTDPDQAHGQVLHPKIVSQPGFGRLIAANGLALTFYPEGRSGTATATYQVIDDAGALSEVRNIGITVLPTVVIAPAHEPAQEPWQRVMSQEISPAIREGRLDDAKSSCESNGRLYPVLALRCGSLFDKLRNSNAQISDKPFALRMYDMARANGDAKVSAEAVGRADALRKD